MSSLKEVKTRVVSVQTTRKITQARQMISSAQLHHAQTVLAGATAYRAGLEEVFAQLAGSVDPFSPWLAEGRKGGVAVVVFSADGGMCGAFNAHIIKEMLAIAGEYGADAQFFIFGKKGRNGGNAHGEIARTSSSTDRQHEGPEAIGGQNADDIMRTPVGKITVEQVTALAAELVAGFLAGRFCRIEALFTEFVTVATQRVRHHVLLPLARTAPAPAAPNVPAKDYILEPAPDELVDGLVPMLAAAQINAALANSLTSEHAARMTAMQLATENADQLLDELQLMYNKLRQQNITSELLDIIGSSFA